ncbi:MAG: hypothetical protein IKQ33_05430 [Clostridia bacterium]|nr:hypothetical protein [Clostridia bacterium]
MKKSKRMVAIFIILAILASSCMLLLSNVSKAAQTNVTVEFCADSDSRLTLLNDNKTLVYTRQDGETLTSSEYKLKQGDNDITLTKETREQDGRFYDYYVATGISSNEDVCITSVAPNLGEISIKYEGESLGMWEVQGKDYWATQTLINLKDGGSDYNHYQFRIEAINNPNPGPGEGQGTDWANELYNIDFGTASWEIRGKTATAEVEGKVLNNGEVQIKGGDIIKIKNYDSKLMEAVLRVVEKEKTVMNGLVVN